ncbi:MAG: GDSL-type esterase/lipase family protein [Dehalococcoidia bacterium]|nr:GDSL-type esterase/lipase family protein [Dehalococcoidia bacterium]
MFRWAPSLALLSLAVLLGAGASSARLTSASPAITGYPNSIAATGDSITQAVNSVAIGNNPENSWATGTNATVNSVYSRILAQNPGISANRFNDSVSGARMVHLNGQALNAVAQGAQLVTILMGANDVCTSGEATMTPVATFRSQFAQAMATLSAGLPDARIALATVPDIYNLWAILKDNVSARFMWSTFSICQSMLANPQSTAQADIDRRNNVRQRNIDFNTQLAEVCAQYVHCRFDNNAAFNLAFTPADVSTIDYFHPSLTGQTLAAGVAWGSSFDFTDSVAPVSALTAAPLLGGQSVSLSATDNAGVSGIEYKVSGGPYQKFVAPVPLPGGNTISYRAVDVNGNSEATHDFTASCTISNWPLPAGDSDCDGFSSAVEVFAGTNPNLACGVNAWPVDNNDDHKAGLADVLAYIPVYGTTGPGLPYQARYDLNADNQVALADVLMFIPFFNQTCTP